MYGYNKTTPMEERYSKIMTVLQSQNDHLTSSQICRIYLGQYTTSDVGSTGTILNILAMAGVVSKITKPRGQRSFYVAYKLVNK